MLYQCGSVITSIAGESLIYLWAVFSPITYLTYYPITQIALAVVGESTIIAYTQHQQR
jgi:hypothetical protein